MYIRHLFKVPWMKRDKLYIHSALCLCLRISSDEIPIGVDCTVSMATYKMIDTSAVHSIVTT